MLSRPTDNVEAFDLFLQGRRFQMGTSEDDYVLARRAFQMAVDKDPRFAEAWLALGGTYWTSVLENYMAPIDAWPQVDRCLGQATALNPRLPDLNFGRAHENLLRLMELARSRSRVAGGGGCTGLGHRSRNCC